MAMLSFSLRPTEPPNAGTGGVFSSKRRLIMLGGGGAVIFGGAGIRNLILHNKAFQFGTFEVYHVGPSRNEELHKIILPMSRDFDDPKKKQQYRKRLLEFAKEIEIEAGLLKEAFEALHQYVLTHRNVKVLIFEGSFPMLEAMRGLFIGENAFDPFRERMQAIHQVVSRVANDQQEAERLRDTLFLAALPFDCYYYYHYPEARSMQYLPIENKEIFDQIGVQFKEINNAWADLVNYIGEDIFPDNEQRKIIDMPNVPLEEMPQASRKAMDALDIILVRQGKRKVADDIKLHKFFGEFIKKIKALKEVQIKRNKTWVETINRMRELNPAFADTGFAIFAGSNHFIGQDNINELLQKGMGVGKRIYRMDKRTLEKRRMQGLNQAMLSISTKFIDMVALLSLIDLSQNLTTLERNNIKPGGIDLSAGRLHLKTQAQSSDAAMAVRFHISLQRLKELRDAAGFKPVNITLTPVADLKEWLTR